VVDSVSTFMRALERGRDVQNMCLVNSVYNVLIIQ